MATAVVTFTKASPSPRHAPGSPPIAIGNAARTESITTPGTGSLTAAAGENAVTITADADCWIVIGADPTVDMDSDGDGNAHLVKSGVQTTFLVYEGEKVAVDAA